MLNVIIDYNSKINYITELNNVSLIRNIKIENETDIDYEDIFLEVLFPKELTKDNCVKEIIIPKHSYHNEEMCNSVNIDLSFLLSVEETSNYSFEVNILEGEEIIFEERYMFEILPYNHWLGMLVHPDLIASFISPNNKHVTKIISESAKIARDNNFSMAGYQSGLQKNVRMQINAVFESIKKLEVNYVSIPPSFEEYGQRIRSIDEIVEYKIANCLDIAVLAASCLEAISLNPFIVIVKGHAFVGAWLEDKTHPYSIIDDRSFFLKRLSSGVREVEIFESVLLTSSEVYSYDTAIQEAEDKIEIEGNFLMGIDVRQARSMMIKPLPNRRGMDTNQSIETIISSDEKVHIEDLNYEKDDILLADKSSRDKIQSWESKLLDLTLRNNLLNFVPYNRNIALVENDLGVLEDKLSTGTEFSILAAPSFMQTENKKDKVFSYTRRARANYLEYMNNEIKNNRLVSLHSEKELDRSLRMLYRESRSAIQENGSNALFLAIGFLKWFETDVSEVPRFSPIILYPIEIVRKGGGSGYRIRYRDEEVQINTTLLEKIRNDLKIEIPGLKPLPQDDKGIDVKYILNTMREAVKDKKRWDIVEWAYLGIFSFNQFVMWEDLRTRTEDILENNNIRRILGHPQKEDKIIEKDSAQPLFLMPADSSQATAISSSLKGENFVLYGPPGTGKSQTITNIIASFLYNGKTVLFVAEKMAALEVVQERLNSIGLADFSLELHSNKSKKSEVLDKLGKTLDIEKRGEISGFKDDIQKYNLTRKEAKDLLLLVNMKQENGLSLYEMMNYYAEYMEEEIINVDKAVYEKFNRSHVLVWKSLVSELQEQAKLLPTIKNHSFKSITTSSLKMKEKEKIVNLIPQIVELLKNVIEASKRFKEREYLLGSFGENQSIINLMIDTVNEDVYFKTCLEESSDEHFEEIAKEIFDLENKRVSQSETIESKVSLGILNENIDLLNTEWQSSQLTWFVPKILKQNSILKVINKYGLGRNFSKDEVPKIIKDVINYKKIEKKVILLLQENKNLFKESLVAGDFDFNRFKKIYDNTIQYKKNAQEVASYHKYITYELFVSDFVQSRSKYKMENTKIIELNDKRNLLVEKIKEFDEICKSYFMSKKSDSWLEDILEEFQGMSENIEQLDYWLNYNMAKSKLISEGFEEFISKYEENNGRYNLHETIVKNVSYRYIADIVDRDKKLYQFSGIVSTMKLNEVNQLKDAINELFEVDLYERLANKLPDNKFNPNPNSEIGYLKKAVGNGGRGISLRDLFNNAPNALRNLAPCMLMSPISVAQYVSPDNPKFDLIIFDEASQVETHRAIGAISRGSQVIVVGDPKQLPPTSFFKSNIEDESFEESDLPSILDEMISLSFPEHYLKWHYRSNHESLITFSNKTYYDDSLYTFPSINNKIKKVKNIDVGGIFGIPKSGQNQKEAEEILRYLRETIVINKDLSRSIGVVTFNQPQRTLILDLVDEEMNQSQEFAKAIESLPEDFFVKNIENVQGDERDLIIFSIGFGPKDDGRMSMNFGPINQKGGSKRLNVAVTRARDEMIIFSSFSASKIDLNRTSKTGPRDLKKFLEYAQTDLTLHSQNFNTSLEKDFILQQLQFDLKKRGYDSEINVGTSGFKIALAITDKNDSSKYMGAVMLDGGFSKVKSLDDRVTTQGLMLERLGWKVINLWSLDWFINKDMCVESIIKTLDTQSKNEKTSIEETKIKLEFVQTPNKDYREFESSINPEYLKDIEYITVNEFYESNRMQEKAKSILLEVVEKESPIIFDTLCRRVMIKFDLSVLTDKMRNHFSRIMISAGVYTDQDLTVWKDKASKEGFDCFRIPGEKREFLEIPRVEIKNAVLFTLENQLSLSKEELQREIFKIFGYNMLGSKARKHINNIIEEMSSDTIKKNDGYYNVINTD